MSVLEFISSLVSALAWPVVAVVAVIMFGRELRGWLTERPAKLKVGSLEAEWIRQATEAQASAEVATIAEVGASANPPRVENGGGMITTGDPKVRVVTAAMAVETALRERLKQGGLVEGTGTRLGMAGMVKLARSMDLISAQLASALDGLVILRNLAAHGKDVSDIEADEFQTLAEAVLFVLRSGPSQGGSAHPATLSIHAQGTVSGAANKG